MAKDLLIRSTVNGLVQLPEEKVKEVSEFVDFLLARWEQEQLIRGIQNMAKDSGGYDFLKDEPELYSVNDLKEKYK
jgi:hypothetical protein